MAFDNDHYASMLRLFAPLAAGAAFIGMMVYGKTPPPQPDNAAAFGCYQTAFAPAISLSGEGMQIHQPGAAPLFFKLERHKDGIVLLVAARIILESSGDRYHYRIRRDGNGRFVPFHKVVGGKRYGVFAAHELFSFTMLTQDGRYLAYQKVSAADCADQEERPKV